MASKKRKKKVQRTPAKKRPARKKKVAKKVGRKVAKRPSAPKKQAAGKKPAQTPAAKPSAPALSIRDIAPMRIAAIVSNETPIDFARAWNTMMPLAKERGMDGQFLGVFRVGESGVTWHAASLALDAAQTIDAPMEELRVDGGRYIVFTYAGNYEGLGNAWQDFMRRVHAAGHTSDTSRPCLEIYTDDGSRSPGKMPRTELCIPV